MTTAQKQIAYQIIVVTEQLLQYTYPFFQTAHDAEFEENKHPRKKDGRFALKGQGEAPSAEQSTKSESRPDATNKIRRIYGNSEAGGGKYQVINGDQYSGNVSLFNGNLQDNYSAKVPENKTDNVQVYGTPYNHKYVPNAIMSNGRIVLNSNTINGGSKQYAVKEMIESECARLGGAIKDGEFYRETNNPKEIELIKQGKIHLSKNHATGEKELGLSTWEKLNYTGQKYVYKISGIPIATGDDGEPVLDVKSLKAIGKEIPASRARSEYLKKKKAGEEIFKKRFGWTQEQIDATQWKESKAKQEFRSLS
jgi:hypothetical protein